MRPISDKRKQPRESLAFITGATGTPVCMLLPFSTWAAFYIDLFQKQAEVQAMNFVSGMDLFMHFLPYNFFSIIMVAVTFLFALGVIPPIGPMKKAYKRVEAGGTLWSEKSNADNVEFELEYDVPTDNVAITEAQADIRAMEAAGDAGAVAVAINDESTGQGKLSAVENTAPEAKEAEKSGQLIDFVIPMGALIVLTFVQDILVGVAVALVVCLVQYLIRKKMNVAEWTDTVYEGFKDMIPTLLTLMAAFMVAGAADAMGLTPWVIDVAAGFPLPQLFPAIAFVAVGFVTFATGSFWGTSVIAAPILLPLAASMGAPLMLTMGSILCGCTMGSQICFFSDGNMLIASAVKNDLIDNYFATLPYLGLSIGLTLYASSSAASCWRSNRRGRAGRPRPFFLGSAASASARMPKRDDRKIRDGEINGRDSGLVALVQRAAVCGHAAFHRHLPLGEGGVVGEKPVEGGAVLGVCVLRALRYRLWN